MQVIGFNFTKIAGEKSPTFKQCPITTNIEITDLKKESVSLLKDQEAVKFNFTYSLIYEDQKPETDNSPEENSEPIKEDQTKPHARIDLSGNITFTTSKDELKEIQDSWKTKQIPSGTQLPLYNLILRKSAVKTLQLQEELSLPSHLPLPKIAPKDNK
jgi:hypothetical protein